MAIIADRLGFPELQRAKRWRTRDAPEIDGEVHLRDVQLARRPAGVQGGPSAGLKPGDIVRFRIEDSDEHDLYGVPA